MCCVLSAVRAVLTSVALTLFLRVAPAHTQVTVKMATLVPEGSSWHLVLKEAAEKWKKISNGRISVIIYPGGVAGDDGSAHRRRSAKVGEAASRLVAMIGRDRAPRDRHAPRGDSAAPGEDALRLIAAHRAIAKHDGAIRKNGPADRK